MRIRPASQQDGDDIRRIYTSAFPEEECEIVARLAMGLLSENATPQSISLVAESDGPVVGHAAFSPVGIDSHEDCRAYILAPLAVLAGYQGRGTGSALVEHGMQRLSDMRVNIVFVYGDPEYYERFGFNADAARSYVPPYELQYPSGWQAAVFKECDIDNTQVAISCVAALRDPALW